MTTRTKIITGLAMAALLTTGLWLLTRSSLFHDAPESQAQAAVVTAADGGVASPKMGLEAPVRDTPQPVAIDLSSASVPSVALGVPTMTATIPAGTTPVSPPGSFSSESGSGEAAAARMYAAHAPLRTPGVADPDSAVNKRILHTMITKMLAQPAVPPPVPPAQH